MPSSCYLWATYLALAALGLGAHLGGALVAWCSELSAKWGGPKFADKFGQQMAALSLRGLAAAVLILGGGVAATRERSFGPVLDFVEHFPKDMWLWLGGGFLLGLVFLVLYTLSWKRLRRSKGAHLAAGLISLLGLWGAFGWLSNLATGYAASRWLPGVELEAAWLWLFAVDHPLLWCVCGLLVVLSLASTGALGCGYLLLRRNRDDFGRDYYRFAVHLGAKWALAAAGLIPGFVALLWVVRQWQWIPQDPVGAAVLGLALAGQLAALGLWMRLVRSEHPMRLKGTISLGVLLTWVAVAAWGLFAAGSAAAIILPM